MTKIVMKVLQGSGGTEAVKGRLVTHPLCKFIAVYVCQKL